MAEEASASLILRAKTSAFKRAMKSVNSVMRKVRDRMQAAASAAKKVLLIGGAALGLMLRAAVRQEQAEAMLNAALKSTGQSAEVYGAKLRKVASAIQEMTTQGDEATLELMALGLNLGVTADQMEDTIKMSLGLAKALGQDAKSGMRNYALAMQGNFLMLARYIPAVRAATTEQGKMNAVIKMAAAGFEQLQAEAETAGGRIVQLWNTIGDLSEKIGDVFLPKAKEFAERLKPITEGMQKWITVNKIFIATSVGLVAKIGLITVALYSTVTAMTLITAHPLLAYIAALGLAWAGLRQAILSVPEMPDITESAQRALEEMDKAEKGLKDAALAQVKAIKEAADVEEERTERVKKFIEELQNEVDMFGLSSREIAAYKISLEGLSQEEANQIWMITREIELKERAVEATGKLTEAERVRQDELAIAADSYASYRDAMSGLIDKLGVAEGWLSQHAVDVKSIAQQYGVSVKEAERYVELQQQITKSTTKEREERQEMSRIENAESLYNRIATAAATKRKASDVLGGVGLPSPRFSDSSGQSTAEKEKRDGFYGTVKVLLESIESKLPAVGALG